MLLFKGLLVDPVNRVRSPVQDLVFFEPKRDLLLGVLDRVGSVADVAADLNAEVCYKTLSEY